MKNKSVIVAVILLTVVNTSFLWEQLPSGWDFLLTLLLACIWLLLVFLFFWKFIVFIQSKKTDQRKIGTLIIILFVILFCFFFPLGIIKSSDFDPDPYLIASREGAANCTTTIILGTDSTFIERSVCFGVERKTGTFTINRDTVFLKFNRESGPVIECIGIIERNKDSGNDTYGYFNYYRNSYDERPIPMKISYLNE